MLVPRGTYTVESVRAGHPDKVCDQISDALVDECLRLDPMSRVAVESYGSHGLIVVGGEVTTSGWVDVHAQVSALLKRLGYGNHYGVVTNIVAQSSEIASGVDAGGAGDQGIMYGYATDETPELLPRGIPLVHEIVRRLDAYQADGRLPFLRPDGKAQITMIDGTPQSAVVSVQHEDGILANELRQAIITSVLAPLGLGACTLFINPSGSFTSGGFDADTGLTGRKIMVDTYGGLVPHGGGCFSGKDPTKVDRSGAYMARYAAKSIVANGHAKACLVSVSYAIGKAEPLMLKAANEQGDDLSALLRDKFDFRPLAIIERLGLRRPIYQQTAVYGHFGRPELPWETVAAL